MISQEMVARSYLLGTAKCHSDSRCTMHEFARSFTRIFPKRANTIIYENFVVKKIHFAQSDENFLCDIFLTSITVYGEYMACIDNKTIVT